MKKRVVWLIDHFEELFCAITMSLMVLSLALQIFFRYVVGKSLPWTEEVSRYSFVFLVYFATILSAKNKTHIRVTAQFKPFKENIRKKILLFSDIIWLLFNCAITVIGVGVFISMGENKQISAVLGWDLKYVFIIVPAAFLMMTLRILYNYYQDYAVTRNKGENL